MAKRFMIRRLSVLMAAAGIISFSQSAMATAYQLWEQDGASIGNYHAGRAAIAEDASTAFYNPAGLVRIHNQQLVVGIVPILTNIQFNGTVTTQNYVSFFNQSFSTPAERTTSQGGGFNLVPDMHYAAPITDNLVFGLSVVSPFGLKTDYSPNNVTRYVATRTSLMVIDVTPSLGFAVTDKLSLGAGLDLEHARGEFDLIGGTPALTTPENSSDTTSENVGTSNAYGYHLGALYQFTPDTRVGLSYQSKVTHHLSGSSKFSGPLANYPDGETMGFYQSTDQLKTTIPLPAVTSLTAFHTINPLVDVMGTISYTQWSVLNQLALQNVVAVQNGASTNSLTVIIPEGYRNTWNYSVGANFHATEQWMFRTGLGYDQTPSNNIDRNLQLPDSDRLAVALGAHYQATKTIGLDAGWTHLFSVNTHGINNNVETVGDQSTITNGSVKSSADVFGFQLKWDIA